MWKYLVEMSFQSEKRQKQYFNQEHNGKNMFKTTHHYTVTVVNISHIIYTYTNTPFAENHQVHKQQKTRHHLSLKHSHQMGKTYKCE